MKIIVTGSLGHISKPLTEALVQKKHSVTVISSKAEKQKDIEALGATAAIGSLEDVDFLATTFAGADAVYTMVPPANYFDKNLDLKAHVHTIGNNYAQAIGQSGIKRVVHLSSIGAHLDKGTGIILDHRDVESILNNLPDDVAITFMRPTSFHYNLYAYSALIKSMGMIAANYGEDDKIVWVAPVDIAAAIAEEIETPITASRNIRYVASDELTCNEVASIIGSAIGKPDLKWNLISNEQVQSFLEGAGMNTQVATGLVDMQACMHTGEFFEDYYLNRPATMGKVKMEDFAKEFAAAFQN